MSLGMPGRSSKAIPWSVPESRWMKSKMTLAFPRGLASACGSLPLQSQIQISSVRLNRRFSTPSIRRSISVVGHQPLFARG